MVSVGVGVHRALEAAGELAEQGIYASVIDLRTVAPLDRNAICEAVARSGRLLVVDEDYEAFGLSGEVAAVALEADLSFSYGRVCTRETIPYARELEDRTLPNRRRIVDKALQMVNGRQ
jgi:pyruvate dehydrogenase E1 component beta subunit